MNKTSILDLLNRHRDDIKQRFAVKRLALFGSAARDEMRQESDIDVLVDFTEKADLFDFVGLALFLEEKLHRRVDVVPSDTIRGETRNTVMKDAIYI